MKAKLQGTSLSTFLVWLIWICLLPLVALATWLSNDNARTLRIQSEREGNDVARNLVADIDHFLDARIRALQILAASPHAVSTPHRGDFYNAAQEFQKHFDGHVILADTGLQMLFNTRSPFGTALPMLPQPGQSAVVPKVLATGQPAVSNIIEGPVAGQPLVVIVVPVVREQKVAALLLATFELTSFQKRLQQMSLHEGWSLVLRDGQGVDIARQDFNRFETAAASEIQSRLSAQSGISQWTAIVEIPRADLHASAPSVIVFFLVMLGATLLAGWLGGRWAGKRLREAVLTLTLPPTPEHETSNFKEIATTRQVLDATTALLRESEQRYHSLFEKSHAVMLLIDPEDGQIIDANARAADYYGWPRETLLSKRITDINALSPEQVRHEMARAKAEERNHFDFRHRLANGDIREVEVFSGPITITGSKLLYSIVHDVNTRRVAERALAERELAFRMLTEQIPAIIYRASLSDLSATIYISPRVVELGYTPEEWLANPNIWADSIHPDDRETVFRQLEAFHHTGGKLAIEYRLRHRNGEWRDYRDIGEILRDSDGNPLYLQGVMLDITDKRHEEMMLRDALSAAQHLREALDQVQAYVFMKDRESRYFYANRQTLELFGCSSLEIVGKPDASFFPPETVKRQREIDQRVLAGESTAEEIKVEAPDGSRRVYWEVKSPIYLDDTQKEVWGISGISTDITAHKELEENLSFQNRRSQFLLELPALADQLDEANFMQRGLEMAEILTNSQISFIHFVNPDQDTIELITWSRRTLESYCQAAFDRHYPVSQAGIWAEALRKKQPVVFNDYASAPDRHGLPAGHAALERLISLPVIENGKVMMLAGVGNKPQTYTQADTETLQLIANEIWRLVQRRRNQRWIARFNRMFERSLNEIYTCDTQTLRFIDANRGACENTGYSLETLRTMTPLDLAPELTPESLTSLIEPLRSGLKQKVEFIAKQRRSDGTTYDVEVNVELVEDANPVFVALVHDITARLRLEQSLRQLAQAVEQSPESIAIADLDANLVYVNAAFVRNTGYSHQELVGRNPRILQSGKTPVTSYRAMWDALVHGRPWQGELINKRKDGSEYTEWARMSPIRQPDGRVMHYLAIKEDITEQRAAEEKQRALNKEIEAIQNQLLQSEKMASIGQLAAGVAHELNNPIGFVNSNLNTLDGYLKDIFAIADAYTVAEVAYGLHSPLLDHAHALKQEKDYDYLRSDVFQLMAESRDGLARVAKIVRDLKDFSRAGDSAMQWANLHQGLDSTLNIVWNELKYKCTVTKHYGELPQVWCEPSQLNQVFMNLLVNASHAIPDKGEITITTGAREEEVFVAIADTGTGIAPENLSRVFDPFFTTKPVGKGTGLGLSLAYSIVQNHRGRIEAVSTIGKGSTFTVWLPINPPKADDAVTQVLTLEPS